LHIWISTYFHKTAKHPDSDFRDLQCQIFNNIISNSVFSDFQRQIFINIEADSNLSRFWSSILQLKKTSGTFQMVVNKHKCIIKNKMPSIFQLIVGFKQKHQSKFQDLVDTWLLYAFQIAKLRTTTDFQRTEVSHSNNDFQLILNCDCDGARTFLGGSSKFIVASHLEGKNKSDSDSHEGRQQFPIFNINPMQMLIFEGARAAPNNSYQLIVGYRHFKIPLVFCKDFTIFCEGVKEDGNAVSKRLVGLGEIGFIGLVGQIGCVSYNGLVGSPTNGLVEHDGKISPYGPASKLIVICNSTKISLIF